jgi:uncharacterized protein
MSTMEFEIRTIGHVAAASTGRPGREQIDAAVDRATRKIAPLWPLKHFVAVNPFLGLSELPFADAARTMARVAGARMTMPRRFYAEAIGQGRSARCC